MSDVPRPIYLDFNATTPLDESVSADLVASLAPSYDGVFGNASSGHVYGCIAGDRLHTARARVAGLLGCEPDEIVFTGCGSESDNLAIKGVAEAYSERGRHIITSEIEHPAVLNTCRYLERRGWSITHLPVDGTGMVSPEFVERAITSRTVLVSVMHANNETGSIQRIAEIAAISEAHGVLMHTDAAQSVGKVGVRVADLGVDLLTVAGHKLYAPKGIGALYVRRGVRLESVIHGAGHESGRRAGTENVPYASALGVACQVAGDTMAVYTPRMAELRDRLHGLLLDAIPGLQLNGHPTERLPNTLNVSFPGVDGEVLLSTCPGVAASTGSACHSGRTEPSAVLIAMGVPHDRALGAVRLSLGKMTTADDVEQAANHLISAWRSLSGK